MSSNIRHRLSLSFSRKTTNCWNCRTCGVDGLRHKYIVYSVHLVRQLFLNSCSIQVIRPEICTRTLHLETKLFPRIIFHFHCNAIRTLKYDSYLLPTYTPNYKSYKFAEFKLLANKFRLTTSRKICIKRASISF